MRLSILIPMFNAQNFIACCLESLVLDIPEEEYEILVLDDGSSDDSMEIVRRIAESRQNVRLFSSKNEGAYASRNKLLSKAKGSYLFNVDADDLVFAKTIVASLNYALQNDLDVVGFRSVLSLEEEMEHPENPEFWMGEGISFMQKKPDHRFEIWWYLIKREYLEKNTLQFSNNQVNADVTFTFKILSNVNRMGYTDAVGYYYRQTDSSLMRNRSVENRRFLNQSYLQMIDEFNSAINSVHPDMPRSLVSQLKEKRDLYAIVLLGRILLFGVEETRTVKEYLHDLRENGVLPLKGLPRAKQKLHWKLKFSYYFSKNETVYRLLCDFTSSLRTFSI